MEKTFYTLKEKTIKNREPFTKNMFLESIKQHKPTELFHSQWSKERAFIVIDKYMDSGVSMFCNGHADKTPKLKDYDSLYSFLKTNGITDIYYN